jgi:hypothetical protein
MLGGEARRVIRYYDPVNPEYVIIAPEQFYKASYAQRTEQNWDKLRVQPSYDFSGGQALRHLNNQIVKVEIMVAAVGGGAAAVTFVVVAGTALVAGVAAETVVAGAADAAVAGTADAAAASSIHVANATIVNTVAASNAAAAGGTAGGAALADAAYLPAYRAAMAAAARSGAPRAAAGILATVFAVKNARAASASVSNTSAIRAVPIFDFRNTAGTLSASSMPQRSPFGAVESCSVGFPKAFALDTPVLFDGQPYYVIGQLTAK